MKKVYILAICIFIFSLTIRLLYLDTIPGNLNSDEIDTLRTYMWDKSHNSFSFFGFNWNGAPAINMIIIGASWSLFGESIFGLRLPSAVFSSLSIAVMFYLGYMITKNLWLTFAFTLATATNSWFLNFSRSGWENIWNAASIMFIAFGLYAFISKQYYKIGSFIIIAGSILGFYFYHPGKLFFPIVILILFFYLFFGVKNKLLCFRYICLICFVTTIFILPQFISTIKNPEKATNRIKNVAVDKNYTEFSEHIRRNLAGFSMYQQKQFHYGLWSRYISDSEDPIHIAFTIFYLIGIIYSLKYYPYLPPLYILSVLPVEIMSKQTPDAARAVHIVPMIFLFALIGWSVLIDWLDKFIQSKSKIWKFVPTVSAACFVIVVAFFQLSWYFSWIQKPQTLESRQPAIWLEEYDIWKTDISYFIEKDKNYNIDEWRDIKNTNYGISD